MLFMSSERQAKAIDMIMKACELMEWDIAMPGGGEDVDYLLIGTPDAIEKLELAMAIPNSTPRSEAN
jgi:hypothetical protein